MDRTRLERLFILVQQGTQEFKTKVPDGDGRAFWQPLKKMFAEPNLMASGWLQIDSAIVEKLMALPEFDESGIIAINHFLRQQVRIPTEEEASLRRIMQVALNSGQFLASDRTINDLKDFDYSRSGLDRLSTYISPADIENISIGISDRLIKEVKTYLEKG